MFKIGAISENRMREYNKKCLIQESETASSVPKTVTTGKRRDETYTEFT
jgi:hypothetical protein